MQCSVSSCGGKVAARGLCCKHYRRLTLYGDPEAGRYLSIGSNAERLGFVGWIISENGCWEWKGSRRQAGYGRIYVKGRPIPAHRLAYETWVGPIPEGHVVRHKCDNPPCINPDHLETGTYVDNAQDREIRTRSNAGSGNPNTQLSVEDVRGIRVEYAEGVLTHSMIAEVFGLSKGAVDKMVNFRSWKGVI